jgi:phosphohistidine phosphatase
MKEITFVRHAKSSWKYDLPDDLRPLKSRGITDASLVAEEFFKFKFQPQKIFSSPATRARKTCEIFAGKSLFDFNNIEIVGDLYDFGGSSVIKFIKSLDDNLERIMIFGHNHAFTSIANSFGTEYIDNVPTSGLFKLDFNINRWSELNQGVTSLTIFPRNLK